MSIKALDQKLWVLNRLLSEDLQYKDIALSYFSSWQFKRFSVKFKKQQHALILFFCLSCQKEYLICLVVKALKICIKLKQGFCKWLSQLHWWAKLPYKIEHARKKLNTVTLYKFPPICERWCSSFHLGTILLFFQLLSALIALNSSPE